MNNFRQSDNGNNFVDVQSSFNVESTFFDTKPVYLDKIFFDEAYSFSRGRGLSDRLAYFDRYHDYSFEYLRLRTLVNYIYVSHGKSYYSLYHYNIYSQFRIAYLFFRSALSSTSQISSDTDTEGFHFSSRDLLFYQTFFFKKSSSPMLFDVTLGNFSEFSKFNFSYTDLVQHEAAIANQPWENPQYAFFFQRVPARFHLDPIYNPVLTKAEYEAFLEDKDDEYQRLHDPNDPDFKAKEKRLLKDPTLFAYDSKSFDKDASFYLSDPQEFSSIASHTINFSFATGVSERSHYLRFFFFPQIAKRSFSKEPLRIFRFFRINDPRVNVSVRPITRNLTLSPKRLYANFPGAIISAGDDRRRLRNFIRTYAEYIKPLRRRLTLKKSERSRRRKRSTMAQLYERPTFDDLIDSSSASFWDVSLLPEAVFIESFSDDDEVSLGNNFDSNQNEVFLKSAQAQTSFSDSEVEYDEDPDGLYTEIYELEDYQRQVHPFSYAWLFTQGDFSILYSQIPFLERYLQSITTPINLAYDVIVRPPAPRKTYCFPETQSLTSLSDPAHQLYSTFLTLPDFWRSATYPFQENDISEYYYFYNNKFAPFWISFKNETYSHFVLNYYPIFLSSDAFLFRNAKLVGKLDLIEFSDEFKNRFSDIKRYDFGLPIVVQTYQYGDVKRELFDTKGTGSHDLFEYFISIKYFYFFYIDSFMRSSTYFFSDKIPTIFSFFNFSANFDHYIKFSLIPLIYDRAAFHNFFSYIIKIDQFFYLTNGWYPYLYGRISRRHEKENYNNPYKRVLRIESTFEIICFYLIFVAFYTSFFFEIFLSAFHYSCIREYLHVYWTFHFTFILEAVLDFIFFTPWFRFGASFHLFKLDPILVWSFTYFVFF